MTTKTIRILHFNDVYNVESQSTEPIGGAARFVSAIHHYENENSITLFSGDVFAPSSLSTVTRGRHMSTVLNAIGVDCAVFGNHDFDFGVDILMENVARTNFPWLNSNCFEKDDTTPVVVTPIVEDNNDFNQLKTLGGGEIYWIIEKNDVKIGLIGLVEEEWVSTLSTVESDEVIVTNFSQQGKKLANYLKKEHHCHIVIALTHMRWPNDEKLAREVEEVDLILGGHDHNYGDFTIPWNQGNGSTHVVKSGTDFRQFSSIELTIDIDQAKLVDYQWNNILVDSTWKPDIEVEAFVNQNIGHLEEKMKQILGQIEVPLDLKFENIRTRETNGGNLVADIMLRAVEADVAILNSGTLRSDALLSAGKFTLKDLRNMLPMMDPIVVLSATGEQIITALENGVSQYPRLEGRFPQVSGVSFAYNPNQPPGQRIQHDTVQIQGELVDLTKKYRLCVKAYMALGKDGYDVLRSCPILLDEENGPILSISVLNYFRSISVVNGFAKSKTKHRMSLVSLCNRKRMKSIKLLHKSDSKTSLKHWSNLKDTIFLEEQRLCKVAPEVEGRIRVVES